MKMKILKKLCDEVKRKSPRLDRLLPVLSIVGAVHLQDSLWNGNQGWFLQLRPKPYRKYLAFFFCSNTSSHVNCILCSHDELQPKSPVLSDSEVL